MQKTSPPPKLFDYKRQHAIEARAADMQKSDTDFLCIEAAQTIAERLEVTNRDFTYATDIFSTFNCMIPHLQTSAKIKNIISINSINDSRGLADTNNNQTYIQAERDVLPLKENSVNLVTSVFGLHRANDLLGSLIQIKQALVDDGLFMACIPGERTLSELRHAMLEAESQISNTASLRIDPFAEVRQAGGLLQRAGFALPVVDSEILTVRYSSLKSLIEDIRGMGATSAFYNKPNPAPRDLFRITEEIYRQKFSDPDGKIRASVEIIYLSGWKPHHSQQKPLKPGSAKQKLSDFL